MRHCQRYLTYELSIALFRKNTSKIVNLYKITNSANHFKQKSRWLDPVIFIVAGLFSTLSNYYSMYIWYSYNQQNDPPYRRSVKRREPLCSV